MTAARRRGMTCCLAIAMIVAVPLRGQVEDADAAGKANRASLRFGGFGSLELHSDSNRDREGYDLVQFDLYATASLSERWSALAEGTAERSLRGEDRSESVDLDLERLFVAYTFSDALRLEFGQTHTGIVRWNEREHRSRFLQTPIDVPAIARRPQDDGAWPLRFVGVWLSGRRAGPLGITYGAGIGAGSGASRDEISFTGRDSSPAVLLSLAMAPDAVPGLEIAAAAYAQRIRNPDEPLRERDITLSASYVNQGTEVRAEWARMNHRATGTGVSYRTTGHYILLSRRLPGRAERARPYLMIDRLNPAEDEQYLHETASEHANAIGVRYDISRHLTVKGEYRSQRAGDGGQEKLFGLQIGFAF